VDRFFSMRMRLGDDLKSAKAMYLKAILFLFAGTVSAVALFVESPHWRTAFLLAVLIWSFSRLYYFLFYVIERYIDPTFRFDGIGSAFRYWMRTRTKKKG